MAKRTASASASDVTPSAAAFALSGRIWISGRCSAALDVTLPMPLSVRNWASACVAASISASGSSLASVSCSDSPLLPPPTEMRVPGSVRSRLRMRASTCDCFSERSPRATRSTVSVALVRSAAEEPPMPPPVDAVPADTNTPCTSGSCFSSSAARVAVAVVCASVVPGAILRLMLLCALSCAGMKAVGMKGDTASDTARNSAASATVVLRLRRAARAQPR